MGAFAPMLASSADLLRNSTAWAWCAIACCVLGGECVAAANGRPPNVLILCADDHAAYVTGAYGNDVVRTPNIDRLAAEGIRFERAYCNSPVCTASRQSFLTGRYPRTIGVTRLETALPAGEVTMAETLRLAGFDTAAIGKMHFNSELKHGFDVRVDLPQHRQWLELRTRDELPAVRQRVRRIPRRRPVLQQCLSAGHAPMAAPLGGLNMMRTRYPLRVLPADGSS